MKGKIRTISSIMGLVVGLFAILSPLTALGQEEKADLRLYFIPSIYGASIIAGRENVFALQVQNVGTKTITDIKLSGIAPTGWTIAFKQVQIASLSPGNSQVVEATISPPARTAVDWYHVLVAADAADIHEVISSWVRVGKPREDLRLNFVPYCYDCKITAGKEGVFSLQVQNVGTEPIADIKLSGVTPKGWIITFSPEQIALLRPGNSETVDVTIRPAAKTAVDTYHQITITADANGIHQVQTISVRVVAPKWFWWLIGGIVAVVVIAGFVVIFLRLSRQ